MSALRPAFFIQYLESCISRPNEIPCHDLTLSVNEPDNAAAQTGAGTSFGANGDQHTRAVELSTYFCVLTIRKQLPRNVFERSGRGPETFLSAAVVGKNRPVATNFQFLKMFCPSGTSLLQCVCISEVILLGRACPKPCSSFVPSGTNGTACRALHNFTEELSNRQEVQ